jgi:hypothetical protein
MKRFKLFASTFLLMLGLALAGMSQTASAAPAGCYDRSNGVITAVTCVPVSNLTQTRSPHNKCFLSTNGGTQNEVACSSFQTGSTGSNTGSGSSTGTQADTTAEPGQHCNPHQYDQDFLGLPHWYEYLGGVADARGNCVPSLDRNLDGTVGDNLNGVWLIGLAVLEILLRIAGMVGVGAVIFGGFKYITSQGNPDATKSARNTIIHAMVGVFIAVMAAITVNFAATSLLQ